MTKGKTRIYNIKLHRKGAKDPLVGSIRAKNKTAAKKNFAKNLRATPRVTSQI